MVKELEMPERRARVPGAVVESVLEKVPVAGVDSARAPAADRERIIRRP
jgi:hypothetical protein